MVKKQKELDITKTGPVGYKSLQAQNNAQFDEVDKFINESQNRILSRASQSDPYRDTQQMVKSPLAETGTPWGESMWDNRSANQASFENLGDIRAENQPWFAKIGAGLSKGAVLAGTTFLNGTLGLAYGIGTAIKEGRWSGIWDNDVSEGLNDFNEWSEKAMPNYYTQDEIDNPMTLRNIFSANFWGDKFIKNIGFTVGAFYSGRIYTKGLGAILNVLKASSKVASIAQRAAGSVISAVNEGSFEALNAVNEFEEKYKPALDAEFRQRLEAIQAEYNANAGKQLISVGGDNSRLVDPAYIKYKEAIKRERDNYNKALAKLQEDKAKVGNTILLLNIPILTASNIFLYGKLYSKGFNTARKTADVVLDKTGKYAAKNTSKLYRAGRILGGGIMEGNEEVEQQLASDTQQHYYGTDFNNFYRSLQDPEAAQETLDWTKSFSETLSRTLGEASTWEQFMIGGMTGLMGMPRFRSIRNEQGKLQSPVVLQENMFSKWKELSQESARNKAIANELNERVSSPEFKNYYQGLIRHRKYQNDMDDAALRDDEFDFKNAEHAQLLSDIDMFSKAGRLEDLKSMVSDALDVSDANLDAIVRNTTTVDSNGKLVGPYAKYAVKNSDGSISSNFGNEESKKEMIESLTQDRDEVIDTINEYEKIRNDIDNKSHYRLTEEQLDELTWMKSQLGNWAKRASEMSDQMRETISKVLGRLASQRRAADAVRTFEGTAHADLSENYRKADRIIQSIDRAIKNLDFIRNLDDDSMAGTLAKNPKILEGLNEHVGKLDDSVISASDKKDIIRKLDDLSRLGKAADIYEKKYSEYLLNPIKIDEDHAEVNKENDKKNEDVDQAVKLDALNKTTTFKEVQDILDSGDALMSDLDKSTSEAAKSFKKANLFKKKAIELINKSDSPYKSLLLEALNRRFNENSNYDDLSNSQLVTELSLDVGILDEKEQESFINEFNNIINQARDKVNSGSSQQTNVDTPKNGTKSQNPQGHDAVNQPPTGSTDDLDVSSSIDKLQLAPEVKTQAKELSKSITDQIKKLEKGNKDVIAVRRLKEQVNSLSKLLGGNNSAIEPLINRVSALSAVEPINPGTEDEVKSDNAYEPTQVTGVLKTVVPEFDLDAKKRGILMPFVGENRNQTYTYVYNKLITVDPKTGKNAFDYIDEGNIKEGDELEVRYEPATDEHPELLALYHKDTLVNYMNTDEAIEGVKEIKDKAKKAAQSTSTIGITLSSYYSSIRGQLGDKTRTWGSYADTQRTYSNIIYVTGIPYQGTLEPAINFAVYAGVLPRKYKKYLNKTRNGSIELEDLQEIIDEFKKLGIETPSQLISYAEAHSKDTSIRAEFENHISNNPTVRVSKVMNGTVAYDFTKTQSLGDLLGAEDAVIGVKTTKSNQLQANTDKFIEPIYDSANADGKVYILIPNAKGSLTPKQIYIRHLNKAEFDLDANTGPVATDIKKAFTELSKLPSSSDIEGSIDSVFMDLVELLYIPDSFYIGSVQRSNDVYLQISFLDRNGVKQRREILLKRTGNQSIAHFGRGDATNIEAFEASPEDVYKQIVDIFYEANLAFNINANKLTGKKGQEYANRLRDSNVLATYLTSRTMQGSWFLLNEEPNSHDSKDAFNRTKAAKQAKGGTRVSFRGREYFVRGGTIYDETGSTVDLGNNAQEVKDLAFIASAYGDMMYGVNQHDGMVLIKDKNGERGYNRKTGKYLNADELNTLKLTLSRNESVSSLSATATDRFFTNQNKVARLEDGRPDTSSGKYKILEEDGKYHEYDRVHSVIGSNWIGSDRGNAATSRGSIVDDIAREFFTDSTSVSKPDSMSDVAYRSLIFHLGKIRTQLRKDGFEIRTDRLVVYHKYEDDRRIAGEVDMFAYNPTTGEIRIYDFKTSRYSTKDTSFSKVTRPDLFTRSNRDQYTLQLSAYSKLFEDEYRFPVSRITIIPLQISYDRNKDNVGGIRRVNLEPEIPLTFNGGVFNVNSGNKTTGRTFTGQYITTRGGVQYHTAPMTEVFTKNGITYYIAEVDGQYKLVLQNGSSLTIQEEELISAINSNDQHEIEVQLTNFIETENVMEAIQGMLNDKYINDSPYGTSVEVSNQPESSPFSIGDRVHYKVSTGEGDGTVTKISSTGKTITVKRDDGKEVGYAPTLLTKTSNAQPSGPESTPLSELERQQLEAVRRLNALKPDGGGVTDKGLEKESKEPQGKKVVIKTNLSTTQGREQMSLKSWSELSQEEKDFIINSYGEGTTEEIARDIWDGFNNPNDRLSTLQCP